MEVIWFIGMVYAVNVVLSAAFNIIVSVRSPISFTDFFLLTFLPYLIWKACTDRDGLTSSFL